MDSRTWELLSVGLNKKGRPSGRPCGSLVPSRERLAGVTASAQPDDAEPPVLNDHKLLVEVAQLDGAARASAVAGMRPAGRENAVAQGGEGLALGLGAVLRDDRALAVR